MSMTIEGNLLPESIRAARAARGRLRAWVMAGVVVAVVLGLGDLGLRVVVLGPDASEQRAHDQLVKRDADLRDQLEGFALVLADVRRRTALTAQVTTRPDWGLLLAALAAERYEDGDDTTSDVMLTSCAVNELTKEDGVRIEISGLSLSQASVQRYVIALEETGLFDKVVLIDTRRAISAGGERLAFNLAAEIVGGKDRRVDGAEDDEGSP